MDIQYQGEAGTPASSPWVKKGADNMTGSEIKAAVEAMIGETIDDTKAKVGINEGMSKMDPIVSDLVSSASYTKNIWYSLPAACSRVTEVNINDDENTKYDGYRINADSTKILFLDDNDYLIHYLRKPSKLAVITDTPDMHIDYHDSLITYLKGWFIYTEAIDDDEKLEGRTLMENDFPGQWKQVKRQRSIGRPSQMVAQRCS